MNPIKRNLGKVTLTVADEIWNRSHAYERIVLIADKFGSIYISKKDVPAGIYLDNTEYWMSLNPTSSIEELFNQFKTEVEETLNQFNVEFDDFQKGINEVVEKQNANIRQLTSDLHNIGTTANTAKTNSDKALTRLDNHDIKFEDVEKQILESNELASNANDKAGTALDKTESCVKLSDRGKPNGIPILDENGLVPKSQLPVDDIELIDEYTSTRTDAAPTANALNKLYLYHEKDIVTNKNLIDAILDAVKNSEELGVAPTTIDIDSKAQEVGLQIVTKGTWSIENTHSDKVTVIPMSGTGNSVVKLKFTANNSQSSEATGSITVSNSFGKSKIVLYTQHQAIKTYKYILECTPDPIEVTSFGGAGSIVVNSTRQAYYNDSPTGDPVKVPFTVVTKNNSDWLTLSGTNNTTYNCLVNNLEATRTDYLVIEQTDEKGQRIEVRLTQAKATVLTEYILEATPSDTNLYPLAQGQEVSLEIRSKKKVTTNDEVTFTDIDYGISYEGECNSSWVTYDKLKKKLIFKYNEGALRSGKVVFTQQTPKGKILKFNVEQAEGIVDYNYIFEYNPTTMEFKSIGGSLTYEVTKSVKIKTINDIPVDNKEIPVPWDVKLNKSDGECTLDKSSKTVTITKNKTEDKREYQLIFTRAELGELGNKVCKIVQNVPVIDYIYTFTANINPSIVDSKGGTFILNVTSSKEKTLDGDKTGEVTPVGITATSKLGIASGANTPGATWTVRENLTQNELNDVITVIQDESNKTKTLDLTQRAATSGFVYTFTVNNGNTETPISLNTSGSSVTIPIISTQQRTINGVPTGPIEPAEYTSIASTGFNINKNIVSAPQNNTESIKSGTLIFTQVDTQEKVILNIKQDAGVRTEEYVLTTDVPNNKIIFSYEGGTKYVNITSQKIIKINNIPFGEPITVVPNINSSGDFNISGTNYLTVNVNKNNTENKRYGNITISQPADNGKNITIGIEQEAGVITYSNYNLNLIPELIVFEGDELGIKYINVNATKNKYINGIDTGEKINVDTWNLTFEGDYDASIVRIERENSTRIKINKHAIYDAVNNKDIKVNCAFYTENEGFISKNFIVRLNSAGHYEYYLSVKPDKYTFNNEGGRLDVKVTSYRELIKNGSVLAKEDVKYSSSFDSYTGDGSVWYIDGDSWGDKPLTYVSCSKNRKGTLNTAKIMIEQNPSDGKAIFLNVTQNP